MQSQPLPNFGNYTAWRAYMIKVPASQPGCYEAHYPNSVWQQTPCVAAPLVPRTVSGGGSDWSAKSPGTVIGTSIGIFSKIVGLKSETDSMLGSNYYSLQMNTQLTWTGTEWDGFPVKFHGKSTTGWEQFVYSSDGFIFIQYWLMKLNMAHAHPLHKILRAAVTGFQLSETAGLIQIRHLLHLNQLQTLGS